MATKKIQVKTRQFVEPNIEMLLGQAIDKGISIDVMERLMNMRKELKAEEAKHLFDEAMSDFQGKCPVIKKSKAGGKTKNGVTAYYYAPLDAIVSQTKSILKECGLSYTIKTKSSEKKVNVICIVKHIAGHSEDSSFEIPLGAQTQIMSAPQVVAAALTFAKRYAFCNALGILTGDDDNDCNIPNKPKVLTTKDKFDKALNMIKSFTSQADVDSTYKNIQSSKIYNKKQKDELSNVLLEKTEELKK